MDERLYLGKVIYAEKAYARVEPLAFEAHGRWVSIEDKAASFPPDGKVFSPRPLHGAERESIWTFRRRVNERADNGKDQYLVDDAWEAIPVVDLTELSIEQARQRIFNQGVRLFSPYERVYAIVLLGDQLFCELDFTRSSDDLGKIEPGLWRAEPASAPVPLMAVPKDWKILGATDGLSYMPAEAVPVTNPVRFVNWCNDQDFVERVLDRFRKYSQHLGGTKYAPLSKENVQRIARALEGAELMPGDADDVELNLERLQSDWPVLEARLAAAEQLFFLVLGSKAARDAISVAVADAEKHAIQAIRPGMEQRIRHEIEASLADIVARRTEIAADVESMTHQQILLSRELSEIEQLCADGRKEKQALANNLQEVTRDLRAAFECMSPLELPLAKTVAERLEHALKATTYQGPSLIPSNVAPWARPAEVRGVRQIQYSELAIRIQEEASAHAVNAEDLLTLDAFARAGELLLMLGPQAELALTAYARCVTGGVIRSLALDPSVIGLEDLWRVPGTQQPTAMAHAWNSAVAEPERLHILCLRNIDAAPFHLWLASLSTVLLSASRPRNLLFFVTATSTDGIQTSTPIRSDTYRRWLVPIHAGVHKDGPISVLSSILSKTCQASRLCSPSNASLDETISVEWMNQVAVLNADPHLVTRIVHVAAATQHTSDKDLQSSIFKWAKFVSSSANTEMLSPCLRAGYDCIDNLVK